MAHKIKYMYTVGEVDLAHFQSQVEEGCKIETYVQREGSCRRPVSELAWRTAAAPHLRHWPMPVPLHASGRAQPLPLGLLRCRSGSSSLPRQPPLPIHPRTRTNQRQMRNASRWQGLDWNDGTPTAQQAAVAALAASAGRVMPASVHPRIESGRTDRRHTRISQIS